MNEQRPNQTDPWAPGWYETGSTKPPKNYRGLIALLLVVVIFLGGLVSVLGILNVKLFTMLQAEPAEEEDALAFVSQTEATVPSSAPTEEPAVPETREGRAELSLNPSPDGIPNIPQEGGLSLQDIYKKNIDSVVSITCTTSAGQSTGTGVVLSADGYLVTNAHVVDNARSISVRLTNEQVYPAKLVGADSTSDLAVLLIDAQDLTPAEFGDSDALQVGDSVAAIGDPLGTELRGSLTSGIVSAINRDLTLSGRTLTLIQTTAALNSGNSGGPLINCYGQVIGINTMKISTFVDSAGVEGIGFAIPSTTVKEIVEQLTEQGYVSGRPTIGLSGEQVANFNRFYYNLPAGLMIHTVEADSCAQRTGIRAGDILLSIDDTAITTMEELNTFVNTKEVGDQVTVIIYRSGQRYQATLTLDEFKG